MIVSYFSYTYIGNLLPLQNLMNFDHFGNLAVVLAMNKKSSIDLNWMMVAVDSASLYIAVDLLMD